MKIRWMALLVALVMCLFPMRVYADSSSIDETYIGYLLEKVSKMDGAEKEKKKEGLKMIFGSRPLIEGLERNWKVNLKPEQIKALEKKGITNELVVSNLEKIKVWNYDDRQKFVDLVFDGKLNALKELSEKYENGENPSNPGDGNSGGGGGSGGGATSKETGNPSVSPNPSLGTKSFSKGEIWSKKGFLSGPLLEKNQNGAKNFKDLQGHWSKDYVDFFARRNIISGRTAEIFAPDEPIKKGEILTLLSKVMIRNEDALGGKVPFIGDVASTDWYAKYVQQMVALGICPLDKNAQAYPEKQPMRQDIVKMLINALRVLDIDPVESTPDVLNAYTDAKEIKPENFSAMQEAVALEFIKGMGNGRLAPEEGVTRGQIAVMLKHFHDYLIAKAKEEEK